MILPNNYKPKLQAHKSYAKKLSYEKAARMILVKLTAGSKSFIVQAKEEKC
jgi:hypothetical protein